MDNNLKFLDQFDTKLLSGLGFMSGPLVGNINGKFTTLIAWYIPPLILQVSNVLRYVIHFSMQYHPAIEDGYMWSPTLLITLKQVTWRQAME